MKPLFGLGRKKTIIIGIHGLSNKPPQMCLKSWWKKSLREGLVKYYQHRRKFRFHIVYWADIIYEQPLRPAIKDTESPFFIEEPYLAAKTILETTPINFWQKSTNWLRNAKEYIFLSKSGLARFQYPFHFILKKSFKELDSYYHQSDTSIDKMQSDSLKRIMRDRLAKVLVKYRHRRVLLIAHSMGSIIAYDVLYELQTTGIGVETFITIGSPLGLPMVRKKNFEEYGSIDEIENVTKTPENIGQWYNMTDEDDQLAAHHGLSSVYGKNSAKVGPVDQVVNNDYKNWHTENAHKSFGYLRTPELSKLVFDFLTAGKKGWFQKVKQVFLRK